MDNTELHYLTYDPDAIWRKMIAAYVDNGGEPLYGGDEKEMLLRSVLACFVQGFAGVDNALRMMTLRYAVGEYLDVYGEGRGCERIKASRATATVQIQFLPTGETGILPKGTQMTADGVNFYETAEVIRKTGYSQSAVVEVVATREGARGNALASGMNLFLATADSSVLSIITTSSASGGNDEENDESYRERIRLYGLATVTTGPASQYESVAKSVSSEIVDAHAMTIRGGYVGLYLLLESASEQDPDSILEAVEKTLSPDTIRPLNDVIEVYLASKIQYTLVVEYERGSATNEDIANAVTDYKEWQDHKIGRAFNPDRLIANLYSSGCTRVKFSNESSFGDGGEITYTKIEESEVCEGTITLQAL